MARLRFGRAHRVVSVGALRDMNLVFLEIDITPNETAQLAGAHAGKSRCQKQRAEVWLAMVSYTTDLLFGRNVDTDFRSWLVAVVLFHRDGLSDVLCDKATALRVFDKRL